MLFLVPHSSHLTQPLDLNIFGRVKNLLRDEATNGVSVDEANEALDDIIGDIVPDDAPPRPRPPRAERGKALAKYLTAIVDAYERSTTRALVVSAFRQAGIRYMIPDPKSPDRWVSYVDRSEARAVKADKGLFLDLRPVARPAPGPIRVVDLILNPQTREGRQDAVDDRGRVETETLTPPQHVPDQNGALTGLSSYTAQHQPAPQPPHALPSSAAQTLRVPAEGASHPQHQHDQTTPLIFPVDVALLHLAHFQPRRPAFSPCHAPHPTSRGDETALSSVQVGVGALQTPRSGCPRPSLLPPHHNPALHRDAATHQPVPARDDTPPTSRARQRPRLLTPRRVPDRRCERRPQVAAHDAAQQQKRIPPGPPMFLVSVEPLPGNGLRTTSVPSFPVQVDAPTVLSRLSFCPDRRVQFIS